MLVFTERDIFSLRLVPYEEQIQALVRHERVEEALLLLDGVQGRHPLASYKVIDRHAAGCKHISASKATKYILLKGYKTAFLKRIYYSISAFSFPSVTLIM